MKLLHLVCKSPKCLAGDYYIEYFGDFIEFLHKLKIEAAIRKRYLAQIMRTGAVSVETSSYTFWATMDLEQYHKMYKPRGKKHPKGLTITNKCGIVYM